MMTLNKLETGPYSKVFDFSVIITDAIATLLSFSAAYYFYYTNLTDHYTSVQSFALIWMLLWIIINYFTEAYVVKKHRRISRIVAYTLKSSILHLPLMGLIAYLTSLDRLLPISSLYVFFILASLTLKGSLLVLYRYVRNLERFKHKAIIVGYTPAGLNLYRHISLDKFSGYKFMGFFDNEIQHPLVKGNLSQMRKFCVRENIDEIFFALPYDHQLVKEMAYFADNHFIRFGIISDFGVSSVRSIYTNLVDDNLPVWSLKSAKPKPARKEVHRKSYRPEPSLNTQKGVHS